MPGTPFEHWDYTLHEWSSGGFKKLFDEIPEIKVLYDIGANSGGFSRLILDKNPTCKVYAFEPVDFNYQGLIKLLPEATSFKVGIFYGKKQSKILWRGANCGAYFVEHINAGLDIVDTGQVMELAELESFDIPKPDLIKLDVEGAEENIIEHSSIVKTCPYIVLEWHPSTDVFAFLDKHLPNHKIVYNLENIQFLLKYEK